VFAGNTFDFVSVHGASLLRNNRSFVSSSDEAIMDTMVRLSDYSFVDFLFGEERGTPRVRQMLDSVRGMRFEVFPRSLQEHLTAYCRGGGKLFLSGSYIGSDPFAGPTADSSGKAFVRDVLRYSWAASHAGAAGAVEPAADSFLPRGSEILFQTRSDPFVYGAEAVDALIPAPGATVLLRYAENQFAAAVGFRTEYGVLACGFPFETIRRSEMRDALMQAVLKFLNPD
jgi:hypothetical protein